MSAAGNRNGRPDQRIRRRVRIRQRVSQRSPSV